MYLSNGQKSSLLIEFCCMLIRAYAASTRRLRHLAVRIRMGSFARILDTKQPNGKEESHEYDRCGFWEGNTGLSG